MRYNLPLFCRLLYHATGYPVWLYDGGEVIYAFPEEASLYPPAEEYLDTIRRWKKQMVCYQTDLTYYYGYFLLPEGQEIMLGPVSSISYDKDKLYAMRRQLQVPKEQAMVFEAFMTKIPTTNIGTFVHFLTYSYYLLTGECITMDDLVGAGEDFSPLYQNVHNQYLEEIYQPADELAYENIYWQENRLLNIVEHGNIETLPDFSRIQIPNYLWNLPTDNLEYLKYTSIVVLALVCRAAIRGGLSCGFSFRMEESYMQKIISMRSAESIGVLLAHAVTDFTSHVAGLKLIHRSDNMLMEAIRYVQENCTQAITVCDVAAHVGYSRPYLAKKFKEELHFSVSSFIMRCRLEKAKELLRYTAKSLSEISACLGFSSQSHFQKAFRDAFGTTPLAYRRTGDIRQDTPLPAVPDSLRIAYGIVPCLTMVA